MYIAYLFDNQYIIYKFVFKQKMLKMADNGLYIYAAGLLKAVCPVSGLMEQKIYSLQLPGWLCFI